MCGEKPKRKGGIKVHSVINADKTVPNLIWFSPIATHDHNFLEKLKCDDACSLGKELQVPVYKFTKDILRRKFGQNRYSNVKKIATAP